MGLRVPLILEDFHKLNYQKPHICDHTYRFIPQESGRLDAEKYRVIICLQQQSLCCWMAEGVLSAHSLYIANNMIFVDWPTVVITKLVFREQRTSFAG